MRRQLERINFSISSCDSAIVAYDSFVLCRFLLSLSSCVRCLVIDDQLTVLPIASKTLNVEPVDKSCIRFECEEELKELKESLKESQPAGSLVDCCRTLDQVRFFFFLTENAVPNVFTYYCFSYLIVRLKLC